MADHNCGGKDRDSHGSEGDEYKDTLGENALRDCQKLIEGAFNDLSYSLPRNENPEGLPVLVLSGALKDGRCFLCVWLNLYGTTFRKCFEYLIEI